MKEDFFISLKPGITADHRMHKHDCPLLPGKENRVYIGSYGSASEALEEGSKYFGGTERCPFCSKEYSSKKSNIPLTYGNTLPAWDCALFSPVN